MLTTHSAQCCNFKNVKGSMISKMGMYCSKELVGNAFLHFFKIHIAIVFERRPWWASAKLTVEFFTSSEYLLFNWTLEVLVNVQNHIRFCCWAQQRHSECAFFWNEATFAMKRLKWMLRCMDYLMCFISGKLETFLIIRVTAEQLYFE